jgi:uncharacterized protein (TIGR04255 family)
MRGKPALKACMPSDPPDRLKHDAIVNAVFELRFDLPANSVAEVVYGRLADAASWKAFQSRRLPEADIPAVIRRVDPNFRFQPAFSLVDKDNKVEVRIGPNAFIYSRLAPYPGWATFGPEIAGAIDALFIAAPGLTANRLGFRYVNALRSDLHGVNGIDELKINMQVGGEPLTKSFLLNYGVPGFDKTSVVVRIATADLAQGSPPPNSTIIADIDVFTDDGFQSRDKDEIKAWVETAHACEKRKFFALLKEEIIARLRDDK